MAPVKSYRSLHIAHITDTTDERAKAKIDSAYTKHMGRYGVDHARISFVPACTTIDIGVTASELVNNTERPDELLLAVNCAPPDRPGGTKDNVRRNFFYADCGDGVLMGGTSNGFEFSYLKSRIQKMYELVTTNKHQSQFRSLQVLPQYLIRFRDPDARQLLIDDKELVEVGINDIVPDVPDRTHVIEVDNFKNVKLWLSNADRTLLEKISEVRFAFGDQSIEIDPKATTLLKSQLNTIVRPTLFDAPLGTTILALKSSSMVNGNAVPMMATVRNHPAMTEPGYAVPQVGFPVKFF